MSMTRHAFLTYCAERIQVLINSKAASPTREEIRVAVADVLPRDVLFDGEVGWTGDVVVSKLVLAGALADDEALYKREWLASYGDPVKPGRDIHDAMLNSPEHFRSSAAVQCYAQRRMHAAGFIATTVSEPVNQDAIVMRFLHPATGRSALCVVSGLELLRCTAPADIEALVNARLDGALLRLLSAGAQQASDDGVAQLG